MQVAIHGVTTVTAKTVTIRDTTWTTLRITGTSPRGPVEAEIVLYHDRAGLTLDLRELNATFKAE